MIFGSILPYSAYKDSGVKWLEKMPTHKEVKQLNTIAAINLGSIGENTSRDLSLV